MKATKLSTRAREKLKESQPSLYPTPEGPFYDPVLHPEGIINLSTAENSLLSHKIISILNAGNVQVQHLKYRITLQRSAVPQLTDLLPRYVNMRKPLREVTRGNSVDGPGIGCLLANLVWTLCDEGEGILMSTPYYHDYDRDIVYPSRAVPVLAHVPANIDSVSSSVLPILKERFRTSAEEGVPVRCLLLCNPHNPLGRCYPIEVLQGYIDLAKELDVHLIVDEVFAHSVFPTKRNPHPQPFISVLSLPGSASTSVHVLASPTKDLGCSGLKAGLLVTENASVRQLMKLALRPTPISGSADAMLTSLLHDEFRLEGLLAENAQLMGNAMNLCADWAEFHGLPYDESSAGVFFALGLSPVVHSVGKAGNSEVQNTAALMQRMVDNKVFINPLSLDLDSRPYRFRFILTQPDPILKLALRRLEQAFALEKMPCLD